MTDHKDDTGAQIDPIDSNRKKNSLHENLYKRADYPRLAHRDKEEYAAEIASTPVRVSNNNKELSKSEDADVDELDNRTGQVAGYVGLAFGVVSLFMWSIVLGPIAAIIGFYAFSQGKKVTGGWAMGLGILATLSYLLLAPFGR